MKQYYEFGMFNPASETEKAYSFEFSGGVTSINNFYAWFPKSQCVVSEPNEVGNKTILIPVWLFNKKSLDPYRCLMNFHGMVTK